MGRHNFKKLKIWEEGMRIVDETYNFIRNFPDIEKYNLASQLVRCAVSIPSNIAEGTSKSSQRHLKSYLETSLGSTFEWETQLTIAYRRNYIEKNQFLHLTNKIEQLPKMISGFQNGLDSKS
ncbi:four helix bundle protein [Flagellimonas myxillae]|uniref:four helix bundle protein n=1 Tax=Flagellimonas myxillae TaxID=2942214 RepID=UPI00201F6131|nr:four helix bundle protein [Muricauda myxillae]MCL6265536.1 four helix bundle protein [Muricauda myxillae]